VTGAVGVTTDFPSRMSPQAGSRLRAIGNAPFLLHSWGSRQQKLLDSQAHGAQHGMPNPTSILVHDVLRPSFRAAKSSVLAASSILAALSLAAFAPTASALEFGKIRALQHGPVGDSPQFAPMESYSGEGALVMSRSWGKYTINDDLDSKVSGSAFKMRIAAGGGMAPSKTFAITGGETRSGESVARLNSPLISARSKALA
jgi:hypothetical protein